MPENIMEEVCQPIAIQPFAHQVGGHSSIFKFDNTTICKPLITREHQFYETMPNELRMFTPEYRGMIKLKVQEDNDGYLSFMAMPYANQSDIHKSESQTALSPSCSPNSMEEGKSDSDSESPGPRAGGSTQQRFRIRKNGSIDIEGLSDAAGHSSLDNDSDQPVTTSHNPWSVQCQKKHLEKMRSSVKESEKKYHKFILLEDVTSQYELPCILDLKMGRRQHGDDVPEIKRLEHVRKCEMSTSASLGVRICGMQVYQRDRGGFICRDKYLGRKLDERGLERALWQFLHNGVQLRLELIDTIILKLSQLRDLVSQQQTFRFYSSSLLIMYEGRTEGAVVCPTADQPEMMEFDSNDSFASADFMPCMVCDNGLASSECPDAAAHRSASSSSKVPPVNVRLIDFAHSTYRGFLSDKTRHEGPDKGFMFGLTSLMSLFQRIKDKYRPTQ